MSVPILALPAHRWYCTKCPQTDVTHEIQPHSRMHVCPGLRGLTAPFIAVGTKAKVELHEREDYIGSEVVQLDPEFGRPVMSITTERDDGTDAIVFAPMATARA